MRVLLSGGGTLGPVTPLLAVAGELQDHCERQRATSNLKCGVLWVGTTNGPEQKVVTSAGIEFVSISSGKLRRYFDLRNFIAPFQVILGFLQAVAIMITFRPHVVVSAGSFVSVPVIWAAWLFRKKILIHQLDIAPTLSNLISKPFVDTVTATFEHSKRDFPKAIWTGNAIRHSIICQASDRLNFVDSDPILLVMGGGTGAQAINENVWKLLPDLVKEFQVVHLTGIGKGRADISAHGGRYQQFEFLSNCAVLNLMSKATVAITRAGLGTLTELAASKTPTIVVPIPNSHQEVNADLLRQKRAAIILPQAEMKDRLLSVLDGVDPSFGERLNKTIPSNGGEKICSEIIKLFDEKSQGN